MPVFTLIIVIALAILAFYAIRQSSRKSRTRLDDESDTASRQVSNSGGQQALEGGEGRRDRLSQLFVGDLGDYQREESELAIRVASEKFGRELDYSHRSIGDVEAILSGAHDYTLLDKANDTNNLGDWAEMFGCYMATVIQKQTGEGRLVRDHEATGAGSYPFHWRGEILFLQAWCHKRIFEGPEFDVALRYKREILDQIYSTASR